MIKSDREEAKKASDLLKEKNGYLAEAKISSVYETNIPAMSHAVAAFQEIEAVTGKYKEALCADAERISALGKEFDDFDMRVGMRMTEKI